MKRVGLEGCVGNLDTGVSDNQGYLILGSL